MGLEQVKEEILRSAETEGKQVLASAKGEVAEIEKQTQETLDQKKAASKAHLDSLLSTLERRELSQAQSEAKKLLSATKQKMLEDAFAQARKQLEESGTLKRKALFVKLLAKAEEQMEIKKIYANKKDKDFAGKYSFVADDMVGGFIAEDANGEIRIDSRFESFLERIQATNVKEISEILFKGA